MKSSCFTSLLLQWATVFVVLNTFSCLSPAEVTPIDPEDILVISGFISDQPRTIYHETQTPGFGVRIERVAPFTSVGDGGAVRLEENANVRIIDDLGNETVLSRRISTDTPRDILFVLTPSYYTPADFVGEIGRSYVLEVVTEENRIYRSEPQELTLSPPIDSVIFRFREIPIVDGFPRSGLEIYATLQDPGEQNYYFWEMNGIYRIDGTARASVCIDEPPSVGWILERFRNNFQYVVSDELFGSAEVSLPVGFIEDDGRRFSYPNPRRQYFLELSQYSIPEEVFDFYERLADLSEIDGEIFDPVPLSVRGNMRNIEDPDERVIGVFGAFGVQKREVFIDRSALQFVQRFPGRCGEQGVIDEEDVPEPFR